MNYQKVFVLSYEGTIYGVFHSRKLAEEFAAWANWGPGWEVVECPFFGPEE